MITPMTATAPYAERQPEVLSQPGADGHADDGGDGQPEHDPADRAAAPLRG